EVSRRRCYSLLDPQGILDREATPVVVEVRVDIARPAPLLDPARPRRQLPVGVVPIPTAVVEPQEGEVRRELVRLEAADLRPVGDDERDAVGAQELEDLGDEPARVTELERVTARRE